MAQRPRVEKASVVEAYRRTEPPSVIAQGYHWVVYMFDDIQPSKLHVVADTFEAALLLIRQHFPARKIDTVHSENTHFLREDRRQDVWIVGTK